MLRKSANPKLGILVLNLTTMKRLDIISSPVNTELKQFSDIFNKSMQSDIPLLNVITRYLVKRKGKQIRPLLVFLSAKLNGQVSDSTYTAASLIELLHTATLIHDDVVDESFERRGFLSINAIWKSKIAVLFGDYLLSRGLFLAIEHNEYDLLKIVTDAVREMSEGELLQIQKSRKLNISEDEYLSIIRKKTATLIAACTACGARSVTESEIAIDKMKEFGLKLGIAFQIKDDLFDYEVYTSIGKPKGNDIQEKKLTLPLIHALINAKEYDRRKILYLINKKPSQINTYNKIFEFVHEHNGVKYANETMMKYYADAKAILLTYPTNEIRLSLEKLIDYIVERHE